MENKRYTAEEVLNLQSAAYQKGLNEGYELRKKEAQPAQRWVKASDRLPGWRQKVRWRLDGIERKVNDVLYMANGESPAYLPDYEWLDEQPNSSPVCEPDFIEFVKNERNEISKEMLSDEWWLEIPPSKRVKFENVLIAYDQMVDRLKKSQPAAGREEDAVEFAEWILKNDLEATFNDKGKAWVDFRLPRGKNKFTTAELYELFKQQKEKI